MSTTKGSEWVPVARLMRPQGRRGELLADPLTDAPDVLVAGVSLEVGEPGAATPVSAESTAVVEEIWRPTGKNAGRIVLKLRGCDDISAAEKLAGKQLFLAATALPALEPDTFYVRDLLGCTLWNGEVAVGEIVDMQFATSPDGRQRLEDAAPLLEVQPAGMPEAETVLVPFVQAYLAAVDLPARRVRMQLPEGLLDASASVDESRPPDTVD